MATLKEYRDEQLAKVSRLREMGIDPYPAKSFRDTQVSEIINNPESKMGQGVCIAGRLVAHRQHGKVQFIDLEDSGATIQVIVHDGSLQPEYPKGLLGFADLGLLTRGDFVEVAGVVANSQTGQLSIEAKGVRILTKVLRPLPDKLDDKESRLRRRYLDMAVNPEVRERFVRRSKFWQATRNFLNGEGFTEINIPVLEHTTGGADANPFVTHMDALGEDFYLRISHELPLKRLLGAGFTKVYDIGPRFRNENYSDEHLPEHVAMEWYWAYANWEDGMQLTQRMVRYIADNTWGTRQFTLANGMQIDLGADDQDWPKISFVGLLQEKYGLDVHTCSLEEAVAKLKEVGGEVEKVENRSRVIDKLWKLERIKIAGPAFLIEVPDFLQPLAKLNNSDNRSSEQFNLMLGGSEACKAYSELNDPLDQYGRFVQQQQMRQAGDDEAMMMDVDFVEMLEYGMPPACGYGNSERLFWMLEGVTAREGVVFPQLRREVDETTKGIYPEVYAADGLLANASGREQDFTKRIVAVVNKQLESWQVANTAAHMSAYHAHKMAKDEFDSGEFFVTKDNHMLPRNSQHPILIKKAELKELHKLYNKAKEAGIRLHVFIKEMIDTNSDAEIVESLKYQTIDEVVIYGIALYGENETVNNLTKHFQLWN
ncbi:DUF2000 family protein [Candidatus Saccharibacteria bacterium]|nr:DUF2000 family protein [Candidatus Saccharibacteria bacterium]MCB9821335.1 DUF2000 family protein [Candidatus Nomurabacteria bacterium]